MVRAQHPLGVLEQGSAHRDRLRRAVTQLVQVVQRPQPQPQEDRFQLTGRTGQPGCGLPQGRRLLGNIPDRQPVL